MKASISISILEWFPIVCKKIMFDSSGGSYITFFNPTIMTFALRTSLKLSEYPPIDIFVGPMNGANIKENIPTNTIMIKNILKSIFIIDMVIYICF